MVRSFTKFNFFVDSGRCALLCVFNESRPKIHAAVHWQNWTLQINKKKLKIYHNNGRNLLYYLKT